MIDPEKYVQTPVVLVGKTRVDGAAEGEALVTAETISHSTNAVFVDGVIITAGHPLQGQSYASKVMVYSTDIGTTAGSLGLYLKARITNSGPAAILCRKVHPIAIGGAIDAEIPAVDGFAIDPCAEIRTGDWIKVKAPAIGEEAIVEVYRSIDAPTPVGNAG
jgi:predicted aconitase with swiveling domain